MYLGEEPAARGAFPCIRRGGLVAAPILSHRDRISNKGDQISIKIIILRDSMRYVMNVGRRTHGSLVWGRETYEQGVTLHGMGYGKIGR
jgi:hypothetical protein